MMAAALEPPRPAPPLELTEPLVIVQRPRKRRPYELWAMLAITLLAGAMRFPNLATPTLWHAEVAGVHAEHVHTPFVMRLGPAVAGTLLAPAVYFLLSATAPPMTAVIAAAVVACSGWMLTYSRESQSHAMVWLICAGALAMAFHLTRRTAWRTGSAVLILAGSAVWFGRATSPLNEIGSFYGPVAFLTGIVFPPAEQRIYVPPVALRWMIGGTVVCLFPMLIGLVPWPRRGPKVAFDGNARPRFVLPVVVIIWIVAAFIVQRPSFAAPAFCILSAVLLMRIPFAPLRWTCVALVCGLNFLAAAAPVAAKVEPPIDQVARDVWQTRDLSGPARTFVQFRDATPDRGGGTIFNDVGRYYLTVESRGREPIPPVGPITSTAELIEKVADAPQLERIIVWDYFNQAKGIPPETLERNLPSPPGWKLISEGRRAVWGQGWQYRYTARRREYVKLAAMDAEPADH